MTNQPLSVLGGISAEHFLNEYWQKKPLLVRQALPNLELPIDPNELAGLSLEEEIESRIIVEQEGEQNWILKTGPFDETIFSELPNTNWTLLIQQLDAWVPEVNALKKHFDFIPNWRIDDVMASYAPEGGSVGPHFDFYDVFLIQTHGEREWKLGQWCDDNSPRRDDTPLSILNHFDTNETWVLKPGDMLYVPPKLAHFGVAQNDCITLSVGFRAPRQIELLNDFAEHLLSAETTSESNPFFEDPSRTLQTNAGELKASDIDNIRDLMLQALHTGQFSDWLGRYLSEPKNAEILVSDEDEFNVDALLDVIANDETLEKNEGSRFFYTKDTPQIRLFADGESFTLDEKHLTFVQLLCSEAEFSAQLLQEHCTTLSLKRAISTLVEQGSLRINTDE